MSDAARAIDALRAGGAQRLDPVRLRHIEALARRAAAHQGEVRRLLDAQAGAAAGRLRSAAAARRADRRGRPSRRHRAAPSALAGLLAHIASRDDAPRAS